MSWLSSSFFFKKLSSIGVKKPSLEGQEIWRQWTASLLSTRGRSHNYWEPTTLWTFHHWLVPGEMMTLVNCTLRCHAPCLHHRFVNKKSCMTAQFLKWLGMSSVTFPLLSTALPGYQKGKQDDLCWCWVRLIASGNEGNKKTKNKKKTFQNLSIWTQSQFIPQVVYFWTDTLFLQMHCTLFLFLKKGRQWGLYEQDAYGSHNKPSYTRVLRHCRHLQAAHSLLSPLFAPKYFLLHTETNRMTTKWHAVSLPLKGSQQNGESNFWCNWHCHFFPYSIG